MSNPLGAMLQNTLSQGLTSGKREMDGFRVFQVSAPISHGSSGGPIFNTSAEVVGIAAFMLEGGQNLISRFRLITREACSPRILCSRSARFMSQNRFRNHPQQSPNLLILPTGRALRYKRPPTQFLLK